MTTLVVKISHRREACQQPQSKLKMDEQRRSLALGKVRIKI
ncbi:MAG: hypothetical protein STSR0007_09970 [Thermovirga sp.]